MSALRLPLDLGGPATDRRVLSGDAARYLVRVRRATVGEVFVAFDPARGVEADATLVEAGRDHAVVTLGPSRAAAVVPRRQVLLVQSVGKGDKLDAVVRDATELGATRIAPAIAERSVARRDGPGALERLQRVAVEASRQCGRGDVPRIDPALALAVVAATATEAVRVALVPDGATPLRDVLRQAAPGSSFAIAVGPEGGFSDDDRAALRGAGFVEVSLGPIVLRTETVSAAVLGALLVLG